MLNEHPQLGNTKSHYHLVFMESDDTSLNTLIHQGHGIGLIDDGDQWLA